MRGGTDAHKFYSGNERQDGRDGLGSLSHPRLTIAYTSDRINSFIAFYRIYFIYRDDRIIEKNSLVLLLIFEGM